MPCSRMVLLASSVDSTGSLLIFEEKLRRRWLSLWEQPSFDAIRKFPEAVVMFLCFSRRRNSAERFRFHQGTVWRRGSYGFIWSFAWEGQSSANAHHCGVQCHCVLREQVPLRGLPWRRRQHWQSLHHPYLRCRVRTWVFRCRVWQKAKREPGQRPTLSEQQLCYSGVSFHVRHIPLIQQLLGTCSFACVCSDKHFRVNHGWRNVRLHLGQPAVSRGAFGDASPRRCACSGSRSVDTGVYVHPAGVYDVGRSRRNVGCDVIVPLSPTQDRRPGHPGSDEPASLAGAVGGARHGGRHHHRHRQQLGDA
mmetsp:Transcript_17354/g.34630  ORF Transcript_17354/g.34630 Transcript_17354/m.34630 type:complete len:307 (-) Transcript_17354:562-1482(-)